jgi:arylsulfatase A-like enzyme
MIPADGVCSEVVCSIDFYPTLLELLQIPKRDDVKFDGISMAPVLRDPAAKLDREAVFNFFPHGGPAKPPGVTVRQGDWKLIRWFETGPEHPGQHELYNLKDDLGETHNLAAASPDQVKRLDALLERFLSETGAAVPKPNPGYRGAGAPAKAQTAN